MSCHLLDRLLGGASPVFPSSLPITSCTVKGGSDRLICVPWEGWGGVAIHSSAHYCNSKGQRMAVNSK